MGFYRPESAARQIRHSRRSVTGAVPSAKTQRLVEFESTLERDLFIQLEADPRVKEYWEQPCVVYFKSLITKRYTYHVPDVLIIWVDDRSTIADVKYSTEIQSDWKRLRERFRATTAYAHEHGWSYKIYSESRIRTTHARNVAFLYGYKARNIDPVTLFSVLDMLSTGQRRVAELLATCSEDAQRSAVASTIWIALQRGLIVADLLKPLGADTVVQLP